MSKLILTGIDYQLLSHRPVLLKMARRRVGCNLCRLHFSSTFVEECARLLPHYVRTAFLRLALSDCPCMRHYTLLL